MKYQNEQTYKFHVSVVMVMIIPVSLTTFGIKKFIYFELGLHACEVDKHRQQV